VIGVVITVSYKAMMDSADEDDPEQWLSQDLPPSGKLILVRSTVQASPVLCWLNKAFSGTAPSLSRTIRPTPLVQDLTGVRSYRNDRGFHPA
jgi:hypothetical protein